MTMALLAVAVFPLTLAYVVVVDRAMDVRMVVRQGLQYAGGEGRPCAARGALIAGVVLLRPRRRGARCRVRADHLRRDRCDSRSSSASPWRLRRWVDRRFFREAYNAEQILSELSEQVRGILDAEALVETVTRKISESLHVERVAVLLRDGAVFRAKPPDTARR
jgi:sigma-B regulation protein RsbU (phosphoserine phosphatase)